MNKIFLACPYDRPKDGLPSIITNIGGIITCNIISQGFQVYFPQSYRNMIAKWRQLSSFQKRHWELLDESFLTDWADSLFVVQISGWERCPNVHQLIALARSLNKPVWFIAVDIKDFNILRMLALQAYYSDLQIPSPLSPPFPPDPWPGQPEIRFRGLSKGKES